MPVRKLLSAWRADFGVYENVVHWHSLPARQAKTSTLPERLHPRLQQSLLKRGILTLYSHQVAAWENIQSGCNVAIVTGTASGKTLCYNLPVLDRLLRQPQARALYLFPTKALAQDQLAAARQLLSGSAFAVENLKTTEIHAAIYDGDTPSHARPAIRRNARLLFSNPDMLHMGILPHHTAWAEFFRNLHFVVIDEMHIYRGVFGSHVANVLRRLKRIAAFYGARPQFILTSATIANPEELASCLTETQVVLVDEDGAARGPKDFLIYNPPIINKDLGLRRSALQESVRLSEDLLAYGVQTVLFARSRRSVELALTYLRERPAAALSSTSSSSVDQPEKQAVRGYRSGYLPRERREIERGLRSGEVRVVVATNALELGIDIGQLGAALLIGYPGSIAATWQQAGRAGRSDAPALSILVATADPLDQFLAAHPGYLFERSPEHALINPDNLLILLDHLRCAAFELPFNQGEAFGQVDANQLDEFLGFLESQGVLHRSADKYFWMADQYPAQIISLRSTSTMPVTLQTRGERPVTIGQVDQSSAHWMVHPQAIYLHEGQSYLVEELDLKNQVAYLEKIDCDFYTEPRRETSVQLIEKGKEEQVQGGLKAYGEIQVTTQVTGFRKLKWYTYEQVGVGEVSLPPTDLLTTGYWITLDEVTVDSLRQKGLWSNDPNNYGPNWETQRELARARDGYTCRICGIPEKTSTNQSVHHVHHKTPFRTFPTYEQANQLDNLITLCSACHRRAETAVRVRSGLAGLAFVLGHLSPFFVMCDSSDLGVHADPQAPLADGHPAVVLFDQVPAGIGLSQRLFELHSELMQRAFELVSACECSEGCPSCVGPGGETGVGGKKETLALLDALRKPPSALADQTAQNSQ